MFELTVLCVIFGLWLAAFDLALLALTPSLLSRFAQLPARIRATSIFTVRLLPLAMAAAMTLGVFVPAWWIHEPENAAEALTLALIGAALVAICPVGLGLKRAAGIVRRTQERLSEWRARATASSRPRSSSFDVVEVPGDDLALCVGGYFKPTIFASSVAMKSLTGRERRAALAHEWSHASTLDPLRLLCMGACPDFLHLFSLDAPWRHAFARAAEFAADVRACRGDRGTSLDLASALVKVARLGIAAPSSPLSVASAMADATELEARVDALVSGPMDDGRGVGVSTAWALVFMCAVVCLAGIPASATAQSLTEAIVALLG